MTKYFVFQIIIYLIVLFSAQFANAQQLVQSFEEVTAVGDSRFGTPVSDAGDVNGDGYGDVIVGAYAYSSNTGRVYIFFGGENMDNTPDLTITGEATGDYFGNSVSSAGDVNGDGYDDVIVGAYFSWFATGRSYIYYGGSNMDNIADVVMTGEGYQNWFGSSVSGAGDLNNDGFDDIIIGAYGYNYFTGRAYIYYGGNDMDNVADLIINGGGTSYAFGLSVCGAGDVNNDGYEDVAVGACYINSYSGQAYIYYGSNNMDNIADVTMTGEGTYNFFGYPVAGAGDVNSDGFDDLIVGANGYGSNTGRAYIYLGGSNMDNVADVTMTGENTNDYFGYWVSGTGDVNSDGYDDVIIGAYGYNPNTGRGYIYYGGNSMDNITDLIMTGETTDSRFGLVSGAGDVNNDGFNDIFIGAGGYNAYTGRAYVYYGGSSVDNTADVTMTGEGIFTYIGNSVSGAGDVNNDGYDDVIVGVFDNTVYIYLGGPSMDNIADVIINGEGGNFGSSVSAAGDVNNDGYDDVIVGAFNYNSNTGRAYIYYGGSVMDNTADLILDGEDIDNHFGGNASFAGDVNGDGYDDVIVGATGWYYTSGYPFGRAYIYYGGSSMDNTADKIFTSNFVYTDFGGPVSSAGDINDDGYDDIIIGAGAYNSNTGQAYIFYGGSNMDNLADVTMTGEGINNAFGLSATTAGDVNSDGYDDIIIGASWVSRAYLYYGGSNMDNVADLIMAGDGNFGYPVSQAGDVNSDGYDDVIVGAYTYNSNSGTTYIYYGGSGMDNIVDITISGEGSNNFFGRAVSGSGDVNGDGYDDVIVGAYNPPTIGKVYIYSDESAPLPVELTSFTAKVLNDIVQLNWSTATEINNYGFEIERKTAVDWQNIGFVNGNGNSNSPKQYSFTDNKPTGGNKFQYRLKQIDNDGQFEFSEIVEVEFAPNDYVLSQNYPNPFNPVTKVRFAIPVAGRVSMKLYNAVGEEVKEIINQDYDAGYHEVEINSSELASGIYLYKIVTNNFTGVKKLIILK